jgi:hypothetical protein
LTAPVNRFRQLLSLIPSGTFYASDGQILPNRSSPYQLRLVADEPSRLYYVYLNDILNTTVTSDLNSIAVLSIALVKGANVIKLVNSLSQATTSASITTRDYATWMAAIASVVEDIDINVEGILTDSRLATTSIGAIDEVFGKMVESKNAFAYDLDTYREILQELRTAFRHFGGTDGGIERVVQAFYHISPLMLDRSFAQSWKLGVDLLYPTNKTSAINGTFANGGLLPSFNTSGSTVKVVSADTRQNRDLSFSSQWNSGVRNIRYTPPDSSTLSVTRPGPYVPITADGTYTLTGYVDQYLLSVADSPTLSLLNNFLSLEIDGHGEIVIELTTGVVNAASMAADINASLFFSPLYGAAYGTVASAVLDPYGSGTTRLWLRSPTGSGPILIRPVPTGSEFSAASQVLFDYPAARAEVSTPVAIGQTTISYINSTEAAFPSIIPTEGIWAILNSQTTYARLGGLTTGTAVGGNLERVKITGINKTTNTLTITPATKAHTSGVVYLEDSATLRSNTYTTTATVSVRDFGLLPGPGSLSESATLVGTHLPNGWLLEVASTNTGTTLPADTAYDSRFNVGGDFAFSMSPDRRLTIPIPNIAEYAGFAVDLSVHAYRRNQSAFGYLLGFQVSYNGGAWIALSIRTYGRLNESGDRPEVYMATVVIPPNTTSMRFRFMAHSTNTDSVTVQRITAVPSPMNTGLSLGLGTVPNNEARLKSGKALFWWSNEAATTVEKVALGLNSSTQVLPGHVDKIAPDFAWLDKYYVTEYNLGLPLNVKGIFTDSDFNTGSSVNMSTVLRTPARMSHLAPALVSEQTETATWPLTGPYTFMLAHSSTQNLLEAVLAMDGVPLTQDEWQFDNAGQIQLLITPIYYAVYTFTYEALIQHTSSVIDLGTAFADYAWYVDAHTFIPPTAAISNTTITVGVQFGVGGTATLVDRSDGTKATASLLEDTGVELRSVPATQWSFVDNSTIRINQGIINNNYLYSLRYTATTSHPSPAAIALFEYRYGVSSAGCLAATWETFSINKPVGNAARYYQLRATYTGVKDTRALRLQSLLLKGLNLYGLGGTVPILRP